jgi:hypothetical protein
VHHPRGGLDSSLRMNRFARSGADKRTGIQ